MAPKKTKKTNTVKAIADSTTTVEAPAMKVNVDKPPKAALSAYFHFLRVKRRQADPGTKLSSKILAKEWRRLDADEKIPYFQLATKDKIRYQEEVEAFTAAGGTTM